MTSDDVVDPDLTVDGDWREPRFFRRRPSAETLAWVAASMGAGTRVAGHRRLTGGANSAVHRVTVERHGTRTSVVLRQYPAGSIALRTALEQEITNLRLVAGSGLPVQTVLDADVAGAATGGAPSLLMTRLPGHVHLDPAEHRPWIESIAQFAARLHAVDLAAPAFRPWTDSWIARRGSCGCRLGPTSRRSGGQPSRPVTATCGWRRLRPRRLPAGQPALVARQDHRAHRLERHPSRVSRHRRRTVSAVSRRALLT